MKEKVCYKCDISKKIDNFKFRVDTQKYKNSCKACDKIYFTTRYAKNIEREREKRRVHYKNNKEAYKERVKEWKKNNPEKVRKNRAVEYNRRKVKRKEGKYSEPKRSINREMASRSEKLWRSKNKDKVRGYKKKYNSKLVARISSNLRVRLRQAVKNNQKGGSAVRDLGCSVIEFKRYLESKFEKGMSWRNYGVNGWHIDHIIPLAAFDLTDFAQVKKACHYTNLQPLWAKDNLSKGAKINNEEL